jgi:hypothetical protein
VALSPDSTPPVTICRPSSDVVVAVLVREVTSESTVPMLATRSAPSFFSAASSRPTVIVTSAVSFADTVKETPLMMSLNVFVADVTGVADVSLSDHRRMEASTALVTTVDPGTPVASVTVVRPTTAAGGGTALRSEAVFVPRYRSNPAAAPVSLPVTWTRVVPLTFTSVAVTPTSALLMAAARLAKSLTSVRSMLVKVADAPSPFTSVRLAGTSSSKKDERVAAPALTDVCAVASWSTLNVNDDACVPAAAVAVTDVAVDLAVTGFHASGSAALVAASRSDEILVFNDWRADTNVSVFATLLFSRVCGAASSCIS